MNRRTVPLIVHVEDRETNRYTVRRFLESAGFAVEQAEDGLTGMELILRVRPELVILDVKLPDISGFELCRMIKSNPGSSSIPVLHVSSHFVEPEARVEGLDSGADAYLTSISSGELLATVRALLRTKQAEDKAVARAAEWQTTFDSVSDPIIILDDDALVVQTNTAAETLLARLDDAARRSLMQQLLVICDGEAEADSAAEANEIALSDRVFRISADRVNSPAPALRRCVCVLSDITDFKTAEKEIRRINNQLLLAKDAAVQADRAKSAFLASMSHELRTPLNAIIGYTEMLEEDARNRNDAAVIEDLGKVGLSARHLLTMVTEILDLSRIEAGRSRLTIESFDVRTVIHNAVATVLPLAQQRGIDIRVCDHDIGSILSDAAKFYQVLLNLLSNACKFTEYGSVEVHASRFAEDGTEWIRIEVEDSGIGIEPDKLATIFEAYSQGEEQSKYVFGGSGLGLSISRRLAELIGGTLKVDSVRGEGAVFTFTVKAHLQDA